MLSLLQISLMLPKFTHFIFTTIDTHLSLQTQHLPQNIHIFIKINTDPIAGPKCDPTIEHLIQP